MPTEMSMPPVEMTKVMPMAMIPNRLHWQRMFIMLVACKKAGCDTARIKKSRMLPIRAAAHCSLINLFSGLLCVFTMVTPYRRFVFLL